MGLQVISSLKNEFLKAFYSLLLVTQGNDEDDY